jgi:hypothetical protein
MAIGAKRRRINNDLEVLNPAPIWRRSLTESGMSRKPTMLDRIVVAVFLATLAAALIALLLR